MEDYVGQVFKNYDNYSLEELQQLALELMKEVDDCMDIINDDESNPLLVSEIKNSDLKDAEERLWYVEYLLKKKQNEKNRGPK